MTGSHRAAENLALLDTEDERLLATLDRLTPEDLRRDTLCPGWSVAHVLTHLARNADALGNLVQWAADGQERPAYGSEQARRDDIEAGARRPLPEILADVRRTLRQFRDAAEVLRGPAGAATVRSRTGTEVTGAQVVAMRTLEVVFHHVDLLAGYTFDDTDPGWVARTLRRGVRTWDADPDAPALTLRPDDLDPLELHGGGPEVAGSPAALLLWLARGRDDGLRAGVDLPVPPAWA
ncbi:maleylpyruvate isomerase family mycothiol-dependent enzyme [Ornithinimicrobium cavernae]|uniref:maleylpyruvate isomerase family mycothiol-dependent enzyme n=1 Tax=Ornithinimicrobium cavernae TaxID=2666047 RepID=UPI000D69BEF5|nr:maleylpyruvate isomerase family mycothiol-dependent enzyme [Ornithinimicrobium cavernae]